jgi:hypothetical protein
VIRVIIHSGRPPWLSPTTFQALVDLPQGLRGADDDPVSATALEVLQNAARPEAAVLFDTWLERLDPLRDEAGGASTLAAFLCYLLYVSPVEGDRIIEAAEDLPPPAVEEFMTAAQKIRKAAREEGREEGREAGEHATLVATVLRLARLRFREVSDEVAARLIAAPTADLQRCIDRILTAERAEDLLA